MHGRYVASVPMQARVGEGWNICAQRQAEALAHLPDRHAISTCPVPQGTQSVRAPCTTLTNNTSLVRAKCLRRAVRRHSTAVSMSVWKNLNSVRAAVTAGASEFASVAIASVAEGVQAVQVGERPRRGSQRCLRRCPSLYRRPAGPSRQWEPQHRPVRSPRVVGRAIGRSLAAAAVSQQRCSDRVLATQVAWRRWGAHPSTT
jgi:hypothetical protein